jgi:hypothetical protein
VIRTVNGHFFGIVSGLVTLLTNSSAFVDQAQQSIACSHHVWMLWHDQDDILISLSRSCIVKHLFSRSRSLICTSSFVLLVYGCPEQPASLTDVTTFLNLEISVRCLSFAHCFLPKSIFNILLGFCSSFVQFEAEVDACALFFEICCFLMNCKSDDTTHSLQLWNEQQMTSDSTVPLLSTRVLFFPH